MSLRPGSTQTLFTISAMSPQNVLCPRASFASERSRDGGKTWNLLTKGLPHAYVPVLREAMMSDHRDPAGVYFGTSTGTVFYTRAGDSWHVLAAHLQPVYSVSVANG